MQCLGADVKTSFCDRNHESGDPRRRNGLAFVRRNSGQTKANGRDRPLPHPLAHHEALLSLRAERLRHLPRLQRLHHEGIFWELRFAPLRYSRRRGGEILKVGKDATSWCPQCPNKGERITRAIFEATFGGKFPKSKPDWLLSKSAQKLEL